MIYKIEFKQELNYVSLSIAGVMDISEVRVCRDKLYEVLLACNCTRVLVDTTGVTAKLSVIEDYEFIKELRHRLPFGVSIALVAPQKWAKDSRFIEYVAVNNGVRLKSFAEEAEALAWLMQWNGCLVDTLREILNDTEKKI
jgi:hypothetical protein